MRMINQGDIFCVQGVAHVLATPFHLALLCYTSGRAHDSKGASARPPLAYRCIHLLPFMPTKSQRRHPCELHKILRL
jgi:hypothetical protein